MKQAVPFAVSLAFAIALPPFGLGLMHLALRVKVTDSYRQRVGSEGVKTLRHRAYWAEGVVSGLLALGMLSVGIYFGFYS